MPGTNTEAVLRSRIDRLQQRVAELEKALGKREQSAEERHSAEDALARREAELHATLYSIGDAVIATDTGGRVARMNPVAEQLTGWTEAEAAGRPLDEVFRIVNEETRRLVESPAGRVLREGTVIGLTNHSLLIAKDGREIPIADSGSPIFGSQGNITGVVLVFRDQTEERLNQRLIETRLSLIEYAAGHSLDELLTRTLDEVGAFIASPIGFYNFVEPDQKTVSLQQWSTRTVQEFCRAGGLHHDLDQAGVWVDCVSEKKPVIHNDYASLPHKKGLPEGHAEVIRELVVPVIRAGQVVAILGVGNKPTDFTEKDVEIVSYLADVTWEIISQKLAEEALRESENRYRTIVESSLVGMHLYELKDDDRLVFMAANPAADRVLGVDHSNFIGKTIEEAFPASRTMEIPARYRAVAARGETWNTEQISYDGESIRGVFEVTAFQTEPNKMVAMFNDVTERKLAEEALRQEKDRVRQYLDIAGVIIVALNPKGDVALINRKGCEILGYEQQEIVGRNWFENFLPARMKEEVRTVFGRLMAGQFEPAEYYENPVSIKGGEERIIAWHNTLVTDDEGNIAGTLSSGEDITERVQAEAALRDSEERFRKIFEEGPLGMAVLSPYDRFIRANAALCRMTGYTEQELLGLTYLDITHPDDVDSSKQQARQLLSGVLPYLQTEKRYVTKEGQTLWINLTASFIRDDEEIPLYKLTMIEDITARKQAAEQIKSLAKFPSENPNPVLRVDRSGLLLYANEGAFSMLSGWKLEVGQAVPEMLQELMREAEEQGVRTVDIPSGERFFSVAVAPSPEAGYVNVYARNITGRKRAEEERTHNQRLLLALSQAAQAVQRSRTPEEVYRTIGEEIAALGYQAVIFSVTDDQTQLAVSHMTFNPDLLRRVEQLTGLSAQDYRFPLAPGGFFQGLIAAGKPVFGRSGAGPIAEALPKPARRLADRLAGLLGVERTIFVPLKIDGETRSLLAVMGADLVEADVAAMTAFASQAAIAVENARLYKDTQLLAAFNESIIQSITEGIVLQSAAGIYTFFNPAAATLLGYTPEELVGLPWTAIIPADQQPIVQAADERRMRGEADRYELELAHKDGRRVPVLVAGRPNFDEEGHYAGTMAVFTDMTERKQAEEEKARLEAQFHQSQKLESIGRLAGGVAHDFNNILTVIIGHTEMAQARVDPDQPLFADLAEIRKAAERSANLTRQLLAFARKQPIAPEVLDLNETVERMLKMLRRLIGEGVDLTWKSATGLWAIKMDPSQIDQLLANLCINARDAIEGVGTVTIETKNAVIDEAYSAAHAGFAPGQYAMLAVSDDGSGMDRETLDNIFEPFFTTKEIGQGTGLGLATVYGIVKQNNGFINVYSEPGQGTTFKIFLPRHLAKPGSMGEPDPAVPMAQGHETILLVEDEPAILDVGRLMLEGFGYRVLTASTPGEAIRLAGAHAGEIHLLMTDVIMPEMNGRDLAKNLMSLYPNLKHLFMSGYTANVIAHHGVLDEGVNFIQKPFTMPALAAKVRQALDSP